MLQYSTHSLLKYQKTIDMAAYLAKDEINDITSGVCSIQWECPATAEHKQCQQKDQPYAWLQKLSSNLAFTEKPL
jgi:hypothetical protein